MPLYIRDDNVDDLANQFMKLTGAKSKTEAVRQALLAQIKAEANRKPLLERLGPILAEADALGPKDASFKMKDYTDAMWEES